MALQLRFEFMQPAGGRTNRIVQVVVVRLSDIRHRCRVGVWVLGIDEIQGLTYFTKRTSH